MNTEVTASAVVAADSLSFWTALQAIAIVGTLLVVWYQLRILRVSNKISTIARLLEDWESDRIVKARKFVCGYIVSSKDRREIRKIDSQILGFFEDLGYMLRVHVLDDRIVWVHFSDQVKHYWEILKSRIDEMRAGKDDNTYWEQFEYLHNRMEKYSIKKTGKTTSIGQRELQKWATTEIESIKDEPPVLNQRST